MTRNIIIDNGTYSLKFGSTTDTAPTHVPNCVVRTNDRRVYLGESLMSGTPFPDPTNLTIKRPIENGQLTQWSLEKQIWDNAFITNKPHNDLDNDYLFDSNLIYSETPVTLSKFQNNTDQVLFEEYGIASLYRCSSGSLVPWLTESTQKDGIEKDSRPYSDFQLVIDSGFDSTWIIPMIYGLPYHKAIKRVPIAGKFLNGYLREVISFRHYNVMDELLLVNDIKEKTCFVTLDYDKELKKIEKLKNSKKIKDDISINYILPDHKTANVGYTLSEDSSSSNNKFIHQESQILKLCDERFSIPEVLFHPELSGVNKSGVIRTIQESLKLCPELIRPLLVANMAVLGGTFNMSGYIERISNDLKKVIPIDNEVKIFDYAEVINGGDKNGKLDYSEVGWFAGKSFFEKDGFKKVCVSKEEYQEFGAEYTQEKFGYKM